MRKIEKERERERERERENERGERRDVKDIGKKEKEPDIDIGERLAGIQS